MLSLCFTFASLSLHFASLRFVVDRSWVCDHPFIRPEPLLVSLGGMESLLFSSLSTGIGSVTTLLSAQCHYRTESDDAFLCAAAEDAAPSRQHPHWAGLDPLGRRGLAGTVKLI